MIYSSCWLALADGDGLRTLVITPCNLASATNALTVAWGKGKHVWPFTSETKGMDGLLLLLHGRIHAYILMYGGSRSVLLPSFPSLPMYALDLKIPYYVLAHCLV